MTPEDIIRAWKDETYRVSLSIEDQGRLPQNPVGPIELPRELLGAITGGRRENEMLKPVTLDLSDPMCNSQEWRCTGSVGCIPLSLTLAQCCGCWLTV